MSTVIDNVLYAYGTVATRMAYSMGRFGYLPSISAAACRPT